jgi:hypothetical protein
MHAGRLTTSFCLGLVLWAGPAGAVAPDGPLAGAPSEAPIQVAAPEGYCPFNPNDESSRGLLTGFKPGLGRETPLVAMYVRCEDLSRAKAGHTNWLPDWFAIETNIVTKPADDDRIVGSRGAVELLCKDAQVAHSKIDATSFAAKTEMAHKGLSETNPVIYFGVIGDEPGVCYMASLRIEKDTTGNEHRLLAVFAFLLAGERWVYLSTTREAADAAIAEEVFEHAKRRTVAFKGLNP